MLRIRSGQWDQDKACGFGVLEYSSGDIYEGQWYDDRRHGNCQLFIQCFSLRPSMD